MLELVQTARHLEKKEGGIKTISYPKNMLSGVNYAVFDNDEGIFGNGLIDLEYETMSSLSDFINDLKPILIREKIIPPPVIMVSYLCAYLGFFAMSGLKEIQTEKIEPDIKKLLETQSKEVYRHFLKYKIQKTEGPNENLQAMREDFPGSIVVQTMRLGRIIWDTMEELSFRNDTIQRQTKLFCSQKALLPLLVAKTKQEIHDWKERLGGKSLLYAVNQMTLQIAWIMGYFAYLDKEEPTRYLEFGVPLVKMFGETGKQLLGH